jgi:uncharacterized protein YjbI with pentapeptide repeats
VADFARCLAHLDEEQRTAYLATLAPGSPVDHRGTTFTEALLDELLNALRDRVVNTLTIGVARFDQAQFRGDAKFIGAHLSGDARFDNVRFSGNVDFGGAQFGGYVNFGGALFSGNVDFQVARFSDNVRFEKAEFGANVEFDHAQFPGSATFKAVRFCGDASFAGARFDGVEHFSPTAAALFGRGMVGGGIWFVGARFDGRARFIGVKFGGIVWFDDAQFGQPVWFSRARFCRNISFDTVRFGADAMFNAAQFDGDAKFAGVQFPGEARFAEAEFGGEAKFERVRFGGDARFDGVRFGGDARFDGTQFASAPEFGPLVCGRTVRLVGAVFSAPVTIQIAGASLDCTRTRWSATATLRVRHATVDLTDAVPAAPIAVTSHPTVFITHVGGNVKELDDAHLVRAGSLVRVSSIRGVDATNLVLTDVDLSECAFSGAFHLDRLRLEGDISFDQPPAGYRSAWPPRRWSRRRTLAEEHRWRAQHGGFGPGWTATPDTTAPVPGPGALAVTYRALRKALEDRGDTPGAADFYYGEMDMRRHDRTATRAERGLLTAYWLLSGYGLRASRALGSLLIIMAITVVTLVLFGLPASTPEPVTTGAPAPNGTIVLHTSTPPAIAPPWGERVTGDRVGRAIPIVLDAVIFRSSDTGLTTTGVYLDMAARLLEPSLLALAVLAIRGRVKR